MSCNSIATPCIHANTTNTRCNDRTSLALSVSLVPMTTNRFKGRRKTCGEEKEKEEEKEDEEEKEEEEKKEWRRRRIRTLNKRELINELISACMRSE